MENTIFRFLFFDIWSILDHQWWSWYTLKNDFLLSQKLCNVLKQTLEIFYVQFLVFELWSILYFTFIVYSGLRRIQKKNDVRGLCPSKSPVFVGGFTPHIPHLRRRLNPQAPDNFGLNPSGQLVIGYHWLAFLNQIHHPSSLRMLNTKSTISQKLKIAQKKTKQLKNSFQNIAYLLAVKNIKKSYWVYRNDLKSILSQKL